MVPIMMGTSAGTEMAHAKDQVSIADGQITLYRCDDVKDLNDINNLLFRAPVHLRWPYSSTGLTLTKSEGNP